MKAKKSILTEREHKILMLRSGILDGKKHTRKEIGDQFKVTSERIRQIEARALRKLWNLINNASFQDRTICIIVYSLKTQWLKDEIKRREKLPPWRSNPSW